MARYLQTAAEANEVAISLLKLVPESDRPAAAEKIARLVNYGFRCNPRAAQSTIRYNAVRAACRGLPVKVGMVERQGRTGRPFNALTTEPVGGTTTPTVEGDTGE
jgi:repressor of nif and glnA expression